MALNRRDYHREYRKKNIKRLMAYKLKHRERDNGRARDIRKTPYGLLYAQYAHQKEKEGKRPNYTFIQYFNKAFLDNNFRRLFSDWVKSGYNKMMVPSCDRIDATKPYAMDNIQFITWRENFEKKDLDTIHVLAKRLGYRAKLERVI